MTSIDETLKTNPEEFDANDMCLDESSDNDGSSKPNKYTKVEVVPKDTSDNLLKPILIKNQKSLEIVLSECRDTDNEHKETNSDANDLVDKVYIAALVSSLIVMKAYKI